MGERTVASVLGRTLYVFKLAGLFLLKVIYITPFVAFGAWLLSVVYLHGFEIGASVPQGEEDQDVIRLVTKKKASVPRDHFHMIDAYIERQEPNPPNCVMCHGTYPHGKKKKVRSMLNLHTGFISCSVCHARQDPTDEENKADSLREEVEFLWVDHETGAVKNTVEGEYGKFPAKIYPLKHTRTGPRRIFTPINAEAAQRFLKMRAELTSDQVSEAKAKLHEPLTKQPVFCGDCHQKDSYIDYEKLGFPPKRIQHLVSSEIVGMIAKYKTFYLPSVIDFRGN